jgi:predicted DNA-binding transcriptional regulator AlpA
LARLLRIRGLENKLGVKKSTIYKMIQAGKFPKPVKIRERALGSSLYSWR